MDHFLGLGLEDNIHILNEDNMVLEQEHKQMGLLAFY